MEVVIPLYSVLVKLHLKYGVQLGVPQYKLEQSNWNEPSGEVGWFGAIQETEGPGIFHPEEMPAILWPWNSPWEPSAKGSRVHYSYASKLIYTTVVKMRCDCIPKG